MKSLHDLFTKLDKSELTQEDFSWIRLQDLPEWGEDEMDYWAVKIGSHTGETYGGVIDGGDHKDALREVAHKGVDFELSIFNTEPLPIVK